MRPGRGRVRWELPRGRDRNCSDSIVGAILALVVRAILAFVARGGGGLASLWMTRTTFRDNFREHLSASSCKNTLQDHASGTTFKNKYHEKMQDKLPGSNFRVNFQHQVSGSSFRNTLQDHPSGTTFRKVVFQLSWVTF